MKENNVKIDRDLLTAALETARQRNLPSSFNGLVHYLLTRSKFNDIELDFDPDSFGWRDTGNYKNTYIRYNPELMDVLKDKIRMQGFKPTNNFTINFLLSNFLNN